MTTEMATHSALALGTKDDSHQEGGDDGVGQRARFHHATQNGSA